MVVNGARAADQPIGVAQLKTRVSERCLYGLDVELPRRAPGVAPDARLADSHNCDVPALHSAPTGIPSVQFTSKIKIPPRSDRDPCQAVV
jgi:hypothetical protein